MKEKLLKIIAHYGEQTQVDKAIEECSELIQALIKGRHSNSCDISCIVDEIADVEVMLAQLKMMFGCAEEVENRMYFKINRQIERMNNNE